MVQTFHMTQQAISPSETSQWITWNSLFKEYFTPAFRELAYMGSMQMFILLAMPPLLEYLVTARLLASPHYNLYKRYFLEFVAWSLVGDHREQSGRCLSHEKREIRIILLRRYFSTQSQITRLPELAHAFGSQQSCTDCPPWGTSYPDSCWFPHR